ncbi:MAG: hypothetical protein FWF19_05025, partial [Euryarchaeota archaeon]|nr:hypothetical protein [Euryarchaeota archaeon]
MYTSTSMGVAHMRIANRFTTLLLLIICGLFIVSGAAGATIYPKVDGEGYYWDGSRLTIDGASASYTFADEAFPSFGIYVDAGNVTIKGPITITGYTPKWTPAIGDDSEGVELLSFSRRGSIGIGGNSAALQTLDLYDVDVVLNGRSGETLIGVIGARNVFDSTITIDAQRKTTAIGIQDLFGTFDKSEISIFGTDETILTGIDTLHGEMSGGAVTIDVQTWSNDFEITGINTLHGKISYGDFELKGRGKGSAIGIQSLHGSITDAAFTIDAYEVRGIGDVEPSGRVDGGTFDLFGDVAVGISNILNNGIVSDATFDVYGSSLAMGIGLMYNGTHVQESEFNVFGGSDAIGILELYNAVIESGTFNVYSREGGAIGIYFMINSVMQGGRFNVFGGSEAIGIFVPYDDVIEGGSFHVYSREGEAVGIYYIMDNSIQGGYFWAIIPHTGTRAIGIRYAYELPSGGTITAWAPTG